MKQQDANVFTKNANYITSNLETFLEATLKSKPKSLIHMGRNISKARCLCTYFHTSSMLRTLTSTRVCRSGGFSGLY